MLRMKDVSLLLTCMIYGACNRHGNWNTYDKNKAKKEDGWQKPNAYKEDEKELKTTRNVETRPST